MQSPGSILPEYVSSKDRLFLLDRVIGLRPFFPSTLESLCIEPFCNQFFRHTGARAFIRSGAVENYLLVFWQSLRPGINGLRIHTYGAGNLLVTLFPVNLSSNIYQNQIG